MNNFYDKKSRFKLIMLAFASIIVMASIVFSNKLAKDLSQEEQKRMDIWAEAYQIMASSENTNSFFIDVISSNTTIPLIITDDHDSIANYNNLDLPKKNVDEYLQKKLELFKEQHDTNTLVITTDITDSEGNLVMDEQGRQQQFVTTYYLYYGDSILLQRLAYFPYVQLGIITFFFLVAFFAFSFSKKAEENQVWVGLSKETAHQLGTPISSLLAWTELIKTGQADEEMIGHMEKDVNRLRMVAERFSKIGSQPDLEPLPLKPLLTDAIEYMKRRVSKKVIFNLNFSGSDDIVIMANHALFEWVIENLCKNAVDAMAGKGSIQIDIEKTDQNVQMDFTDSGKGIPKAKYKTIFNPGFTTKTRGWGLGLSLTQRIVENYHKGKIFVRSSEINKGTTFRVILPLAAI